MSDSGTGAAPLIIQRTVSCLCLSESYVSNMNWSAAGTASVTVIFSSSKLSQTLTGSNSLMMTAVPPRYTMLSNGLSAPTWKSGRLMR